METKVASVTRDDEKPIDLGTAGESEQKHVKKLKNWRRKESAEDANKRRCLADEGRAKCVYDPNSDHRRKGVYKKDIDNLKTRNSTLQTLIQAILNYPEDAVPDLIKQIRTCESLDDVAESILARDNGLLQQEEDDSRPGSSDSTAGDMPTFETRLSGKMGELRLDDGSVRYLGGTSNLIHLGMNEGDERLATSSTLEEYKQQDNPYTSWTTVTNDPDLIQHLINMYFTWHYTYFCCLSKAPFYREFLLGRPPSDTRRKVEYCTPLLVNAMLALGCHFTSAPGTRENPEDSATAGDHFFKEAKRLILENDEHEKPKLCTVQALALMSVREAGCGREAKGWVYSGMSFRMACDLGLNLNSGDLSSAQGSGPNAEEEDARRITFWGCFLFDKCWSNYLGRMPQLPPSIITVPKFEVFPNEDAEEWAPYTDSGFSQAHAQPARTRAVALQVSALCELSNDLMNFFYSPQDIEKSRSKQAELKKLSDIHTRLEAWRKNLPKEMEPKEGGLSNVLVMHMFFHLLYIHTFRPFLKYDQATSPLPANVSPRKICSQAASMISKLLRLYKRSHGLRQICNIAVYIAHSACTIHLLNLPDKNAKRDIVHGLRHLEEIAEGWLCARRTLGILSLLAKKWNVELPEEALIILTRTDTKFGPYLGGDTSPDATMKVAAGNVQQTQQVLQANEQLSFFHPNGSSVPQGTRRTSSGNSLPPHSVHDLHYPSRHNVGNSNATSPGQQPRGSLDSTSNAASPTDMFGGIDQLIREGNDWTLKDQTNLALGFDNWGPADWNEALWGTGNPLATTGPTNGGTYGFDASNLANLNGINPGASITSAPNGNLMAANMMNSMNGMNGMNGLNGSDDGYQGNGFIDNESDWYN
ncbi:MAG: Nitrogen assimilation transcription factor nit-4 [Bogoriella megaspora]|nr:MAG: Nitrogen assimilation transcription factor nit-4 [Bogoriella megaspora]